MRNEQWCQVCDRFIENGCSRHKITRVQDQKPSPLAISSLPPLLKIKTLLKDESSQSKPENYNVFAKKQILKNVEFGPLLCEHSAEECSSLNNFSLIILQPSHKLYCKLTNLSACNWMALVKPADCLQSQNLLAYMSSRDHCIYFITSKNIPRNQELRVWYTEEYARKIGKESVLPSLTTTSPLPSSDSSIFLSKRMRKVSRRVRESYYYESPNEELDKAHGENDKDNNDDDDAYDPSVTKPSVQKRSPKRSSTSRRMRTKEMGSQGLGLKSFLCRKCDLVFSDANVFNLHTLVHAAVTAGFDEDVSGNSPEERSALSNVVTTKENITKDASKIKALVNNSPVSNGFKASESSVNKLQEGGKRKEEERVKEKEIRKEREGEGEGESKMFVCPVCRVSFMNKLLLVHHTKEHATGAVTRGPPQRSRQKLDQRKQSQTSQPSSSLHKGDFQQHTRDFYNETGSSGKLEAVLDTPGWDSKEGIRLRRSETLKKGDTEIPGFNKYKQFGKKSSKELNGAASGLGEKNVEQENGPTTTTSSDLLFYCKICRKQFSTSSAFSVHNKVHSHKRFYTCSLCDQSFKLYSQLQQHGRSVHVRRKGSLEGGLGGVGEVLLSVVGAFEASTGYLTEVGGSEGGGEGAVNGSTRNRRVERSNSDAPGNSGVSKGSAEKEGCTDRSSCVEQLDAGHLSHDQVTATSKHANITQAVAAAVTHTTSWTAGNLMADAHHATLGGEENKGVSNYSDYLNDFVSCHLGDSHINYVTVNTLNATTAAITTTTTTVTTTCTTTTITTNTTTTTNNKNDDEIRDRKKRSCHSENVNEEVLVEWQERKVEGVVVKGGGGDEGKKKAAALNEEAKGGDCYGDGYGSEGGGGGGYGCVIGSKRPSNRDVGGVVEETDPTKEETKQKVYEKEERIEVNGEGKVRKNKNEERVKEGERRMDEFYDCPECHRSFESFEAIRRHMRRLHSGRRYPCPVCGKELPLSDKLKLHLLSHSTFREFVCERCGKQFKRKDKLRDHVKRLHLAKKKRRKKKMDDHNAVVDNDDDFDDDYDDDGDDFGLGSKVKFVPETPPSEYSKFTYKCYSCLLGFKRRGMLVNHLLKKHPHQPIDSVHELSLPILKYNHQFFCIYCEKVFKSNSKRKQHILKAHPGFEPPTSLRGFKKLQKQQGDNATKASFTTITGHVTVDPFPCTLCSSQFSSKSKLHQHLKKKHHTTPHFHPTKHQQHAQQRQLQHQQLIQQRRPTQQHTKRHQANHQQVEQRNTQQQYTQPQLEKSQPQHTHMNTHTHPQNNHFLSPRQQHIHSVSTVSQLEQENLNNLNNNNFAANPFNTPPTATTHTTVEKTTKPCNKTILQQQQQQRQQQQQLILDPFLNNPLYITTPSFNISSNNEFPGTNTSNSTINTGIVLLSSESDRDNNCNNNNVVKILQHNINNFNNKSTDLNNSNKSVNNTINTSFIQQCLLQPSQFILVRDQPFLPNSNQQNNDNSNNNNRNNDNNTNNNTNIICNTINTNILNSSIITSNKVSNYDNDDNNDNSFINHKTINLNTNLVINDRLYDKR